MFWAPLTSIKHPFETPSLEVHGSPARPGRKDWGHTTNTKNQWKNWLHHVMLLLDGPKPTWMRKERAVTFRLPKTHLDVGVLVDVGF